MPAMPKNESVLIRLEEGTLARIDDVLERFEERSHMLREAIEHEIVRRKRQKGAQQTSASRIHPSKNF
jgi:metal-responsive CopG/Arc/MetJ family transcriptional regulator